MTSLVLPGKLINSPSPPQSLINSLTLAILFLPQHQSLYYISYQPRLTCSHPLLSLLISTILNTCFSNSCFTKHPLLQNKLPWDAATFAFCLGSLISLQVKHPCPNHCTQAPLILSRRRNIDMCFCCWSIQTQLIFVHWFYIQPLS